jgi:uncharacterized protein YndB with AHSA1/START domain
MGSRDFSVSITVDQRPEAVFAAVNNVRGWWSEEVSGETGTVGSSFTYRYGDVHYSKQTISELVPGRRVVWRIDEARLNFTRDPDEWVGTEICFEIEPANGATELRFTHRGLTDSLECYGACSGAWTFYVTESLRDLITTGVGQPDHPV